MTTNDGSPPPSIPRRRVLEGLGAVTVTAAIGCGGDDGADGATNATTSAGGTGGAGGATSTSSQSGAGGAGAQGGAGQGGEGGAGGAGGGEGGEGGQGGGEPGPSCTGSGGLTAAQLLAPIDTIVVLCMENRSFDHYLGSLLLVEKRPADGLSGKEVNPDPDGKPISPFLLEDFTVADPPHGWDDVHAQWNGGKNDQFVIAHAGPNQNEVMGYHVREQLPITYALADAYAVCDRWFCSVLGPTWPNRYYLHGATSKGRKSNLPVTGFKSIFELCDEAGISHRNYYGDFLWAAGAYLKLSGNAGIEDFFEDAAAGKLPQFSIIDPVFFGDGANDDHPDHNVQLGQALIASVYGALAQSPQWKSCLLVITYDEHGGFFDHVPPPQTVDDDPEFAQLGFRVPTLVCGPHVRKGCAVSAQLEHVSVIKTATVRWGLPSLNARVDATADLAVAIDPAYVNDPQPPIVLPKVPVSLSRLRQRRIADPQRTHIEMWEAAEKGIIPRHLDRRSQSMDITQRILAHGARLGAVRVLD